jgi:ankyrin repeat protein
MACTLSQLFKAIGEDNVQAVKRVLSYNPSLAHGKHPREGHTPLHAAAALGSLGLVRELLAAGASCQAVDANFEVPLHVACHQVRPKLAAPPARACGGTSGRHTHL